MRYPKPIKDGGRVGFIAPSFGCTTEPYRTRFLSAIDHFKNNGYETVLGPNCFSESGVGKSNTAVACGAEVNEYLTHDHSDVIISCGGGETMCEDLPFIDFDAIAQAPAKWYMGYSDNTHLTFTLPTLSAIADARSGLGRIARERTSSFLFRFGIRSTYFWNTSALNNLASKIPGISILLSCLPFPFFPSPAYAVFCFH